MLRKLLRAFSRMYIKQMASLVNGQHVEDVF